MAERVVDGLEVIEVEHEQRSAVAIAVDMGDVALELCLEAAAVEQACERVVVRHVAQLALHHAPLGDVHKVRQDLERVAIRITQHAYVARDPDRVAVCAQQPAVTDVAVNLTADQLGVHLCALLELLGMGDRRKVHREQLVARVAGDVTHRVVCLQQPPVRARDRHPHRSVLKRDLEALPRGLHVTLDRAQLGHVLDGADEDSGAGGIGPPKRVHDPARAVGCIDAVLELEHRAAGQHLPVGACDGVAVFVVDQLEALLPVRSVCSLRQAEDALHLRGPFELTGLGVPDPRTDTGDLLGFCERLQRAVTRCVGLLAVAPRVPVLGERMPDRTNHLVGFGATCKIGGAEPQHGCYGGTAGIVAEDDHGPLTRLADHRAKPLLGVGLCAIMPEYDGVPGPVAEGRAEILVGADLLADPARHRSEMAGESVRAL